MQLTSLFDNASAQSNSAANQPVRALPPSEHPVRVPPADGAATITPERADLAALHAEIVRAFAFWNDRCWGGRLPTPLFTFFPQSSSGWRLGHFRARSWTIDSARGAEEEDLHDATEGDEHHGHGRQPMRDEIVFYADLCLGRGMTQVLETLVHEMVHLWEEHFGRAGRHNYHKIAWHHEAQRVGLVTDLSDDKGHSSGGPEFFAAVAGFKPRLAGIPFRPKPLAVARKHRSHSWRCGCGYSVRVYLAAFSATCNVCGNVFRKC